MNALGAGATLCDGRYRLDEVIGRGGMALVWRATDQQLERSVAIKVISDALAADPSFVARFEREARLAAALNHENLVKVFDYSVESERPFLVMEFVPGGTLAEARDRRDPLDVDSLARQLLEALAHIHDAGILHRDIKPANVLLTGDGSPRLTDFGIARGEETSGLTQPGQVLGTLRYIAPEVAAGEPASIRSDLYSLGVLLGELEGTPSEPLSRLVSRLTARDPAQRPTTAAEALSELETTRVLPDPDKTQRLDPTPATPAGGGGLTPSPRWGIHSAPRRVRPAHAVAAAVLVLVVLVLVIAGGSGGSGGGGSQASPVRPAAAGAPVDRQLDRLEQIVRAQPGRD